MKSEHGTRARQLAIPLLALLLGACASTSTRHVLGMDQSQVALRSIQTRAFDTTDRLDTIRSIIATLQDLGFVIDKADDVLGTVSATKLDGYKLRMTVTVRQRGEAQVLVRASAQFERQAVDEPGPYQQFFTALEKSMFLTAHEVG